MEDISTVTVPVVETTKTEEMIPQSQVGGLVAKESKLAIEKLLKDLGVEDFKSAKDGLTKFKEMQEAQKTNAEKLVERLNLAEQELTTYKSQEQTRKVQDSIKEVLTSLEIDTKYAKTIQKLTDLSNVEEINAENIKSLIENTINEELPMLISGEKVKIGGEKTEVKPTSTVKNYLDDKYKNNPFYKK